MLLSDGDKLIVCSVCRAVDLEEFPVRALDLEACHYRTTLKLPRRGVVAGVVIGCGAGLSASGNSGLRSLHCESLSKNASSNFPVLVLCSRAMRATCCSRFAS